jgi:CubicO group peptidase (beta-lactamase class C family)
MSARAFGHTGFTGTSLWVDPERGLFVVLLMNRVRASEAGTRYAQLRRDVADAVERSIQDAPLTDWESRR